MVSVLCMQNLSLLGLRKTRCFFLFLLSIFSVSDHKLQHLYIYIYEINFWRHLKPMIITLGGLLREAFGRGPFDQENLKAIIVGFVSAQWTMFSFQSAWNTTSESHVMYSEFSSNYVMIIILYSRLHAPEIRFPAYVNTMCDPNLVRYKFRGKKQKQNIILAGAGKHSYIQSSSTRH